MKKILKIGGSCLMFAFAMLMLIRWQETTVDRMASKLASSENFVRLKQLQKELEKEVINERKKNKSLLNKHKRYEYDNIVNSSGLANPQKFDSLAKLGHVTTQKMLSLQAQIVQQMIAVNNEIPELASLNSGEKKSVFQKANLAYTNTNKQTAFSN